MIQATYYIPITKELAYSTTNIDSDKRDDNE